MSRRVKKIHVREAMKFFRELRPNKSGAWLFIMHGGTLINEVLRLRRELKKTNKVVERLSMALKKPPPEPNEYVKLIYLYPELKREMNRPQHIIED